MDGEGGFKELLVNEDGDSRGRWFKSSDTYGDEEGTGDNNQKRFLA
jgi:hypothetical protein